MTKRSAPQPTILVKANIVIEGTGERLPVVVRLPLRVVVAAVLA